MQPANSAHSLLLLVAYVATSYGWITENFQDLTQFAASGESSFGTYESTTPTLAHTCSPSLLTPTKGKSVWSTARLLPTLPTSLKDDATAPFVLQATLAALKDVSADYTTRIILRKGKAFKGDKLSSYPPMAKLSAKDSSANGIVLQWVRENGNVVFTAHLCGVEVHKREQPIPQDSTLHTYALHLVHSQAIVNIMFDGQAVATFPLPRSMQGNTCWLANPTTEGHALELTSTSIGSNKPFVAIHNVVLDTSLVSAITSYQSVTDECPHVHVPEPQSGGRNGRGRERSGQKRKPAKSSAFDEKNRQNIMQTRMQEREMRSRMKDNKTKEPALSAEGSCKVAPDGRYTCEAASRAASAPS
eukprot:TRINITY_DN85930_c0_g1_i1.p1 TRINITY_DN85930_c0_g1~~TRINITY_DN85930_c0_g1_i1.p1  ORF type:complete len:359 (-),score=17.29 TRINITY_DN85930_c0_g1_i1:73-1149(-)